MKLIRHKHPDRHHHCDHNPGLMRGQDWPARKQCDRPHWHWVRRSHA